jgi:hypothetical protein
MQFQLLTNAMMFRAGTTNKNPRSTKYMSMQMLSQINVMVSAGCASCWGQERRHARRLRRSGGGRLE